MQLDTIYKFIENDLNSIGDRILEVSQVEQPQVADSLKYVLETGGKRMRPALALMAGQFYQYDRELHTCLAAAVELLHIGTLLHDDIMDKATIRHSKPTPNSIWGGGKAVLIGDLVFANAAAQAARTKNLRVIELFAQTLMDITSGELQQSLNAFNAEQGRQEYYFRISHKTASLFAAAGEGAAILSQAPEEFVSCLKDYGYYFGISFQIIDDILDVIGDEQIMGKPVGSDLLSGVITLPSLLVVEREGNNKTLKEVFAQRGNTEIFQQFLGKMQRHEIIKECYSIATDFCSKAQQSLDILPDKPAKQALKDLADFILHREK